MRSNKAAMTNGHCFETFTCTHNFATQFQKDPFLLQELSILAGHLHVLLLFPVCGSPLQSLEFPFVIDSDCPCAFVLQAGKLIHQ